MADSLNPASNAGAIILASGSSSRRSMLAAAAVRFAAVPADIDERALEAAMAGEPPAVIARSLARTKALSVSKAHPGRVVLGSDSLVAVDGRRFDKPRNREEAAGHLAFFSGKAMELHSAAALARDGEILWDHGDVARLKVRTLSTLFIESYLDLEWPEVAQCVGVFRIEGIGVHLFEHIEGSQFTVLGMPLLAVLAALRDLGLVPR